MNSFVLMRSLIFVHRAGLASRAAGEAVASALRGRVRAARVDADARGSDHQPLWVDMDL